MPRPRKTLVFRTILAISILLAVFLAGNTVHSQGTTYEIAVDAGRTQGGWDRFYENCVGACHPSTVLGSAYGRDIQAALAKGKNEAGFKMVRCHGILGKDVGLYSEVNGVPVYNWTKFDQIYDAIRAQGVHPILELSFMPEALAAGANTNFWYNGAPGNVTPPRDYGKWKDLVKEIVLHVEKRYGKKEIQEKWYFEVWNEPDLGCFWTGTREDYFKLYDYAAQGLQEADPKCRIGGPAVSGCNPAWVEAFLHHVRSGKNFATGRPGTKCDFVSYHVYSDDPSINGLRSTPGGMLKYQRMVEGYIGRFGFEGAVFCTEWAPCSGNLPLHSDLESAGSFVAKTIHLLADNAGILPMAYSFWCISDIFEEWDARPKTAFDGSFGLLLRGDPAVPDSFEVAKASFNAFKILHQLGDQRLEMTGGTMGNGVNGLATRSGRSLQILLYNHVDGGGADSALADTIKLAVNNLPVAAGKAVMERIILDRAHSNAYLAWKEMGSPSRPTAEQWAKLKKAAELHQEPAETLQITGGRLTGEFKLNVYGVTLLKIAY